MPVIERIDVTPFVVPTASPESDGTLEWDKTTLVLVEAQTGGVRSVGYTYADTSTAMLIKDLLANVVRGRPAMDVSGAWDAMVRAVRNLGRPGIASMAIAAVDSALWDLKARLLGVPVVTLLGAVRPEIPVYGSGGFTSYSIEELQGQLARWVADGITRVKMKVGRDATQDLHRVAGGTRGDRIDRRAFCRRERRVYAEAGARPSESIRRVGSDLVRRTGFVRRS